MSLVFTIPIGFIINTKQVREVNLDNGSNANTKLPLILLIILTVGWLLGYYGRFKSMANDLDYLIALELFVLVLVIGLDIGSSINTQLLARGYLGVAIAATSLLGSSVSGLVLHYLVGVPLAASLGISMGGMGWYSLAGPLLSIRFGPAWVPWPF